MLLQGKVAVVTGASRGIGRATAIAWAAAGADLVLASTNVDALNETRKQVLEHGGKCIVVPCDVSNENQVEELQIAAKTLGDVDVLFNCAGGPGRYISLADLSVEDWDHTMAVNLRGTFLCCKAFIPSMKSRRSGCIINVASSDRALPMMSAYHTTKFGIVALTQALASEVAEFNVAVNAVRFGVPVDTVLARDVNGNRTDYEAWQQPEDVAPELTFLASQTGIFVTGGYINLWEWRQQLSGPLLSAATPVPAKQ